MGSKPEGLSSSSSEEGKGMKRLVGPPIENPQVIIKYII